MKDEGKHPFELSSPRNPTRPHRGRSKDRGGETPTVGRLELGPEARMGVRLLRRAMLGRLVVTAINCDFVGTD